MAIQKPTRIFRTGANNTPPKAKPSSAKPKPPGDSFENGTPPSKPRGIIEPKKVTGLEMPPGFQPKKVTGLEMPPGFQPKRVTGLEMPVRQPLMAAHAAPLGQAKGAATAVGAARTKPDDALRADPQYQHMLQTLANPENFEKLAGDDGVISIKEVLVASLPSSMGGISDPELRKVCQYLCGNPDVLRMMDTAAAYMRDGNKINMGDSPEGRRTTLPADGLIGRDDLDSLYFDCFPPEGNVGSETRPSINIHAPLESQENTRTAAKYEAVMEQFSVTSNPRYANGDNKTFCNIFVSDVTRAMGAEIPHRIDTEGNIVQEGGGELLVYYMNEWLKEHGAAHGWRVATPEEAQEMANQGKPAIVIQPSLDERYDHIAMVRPGTMDPVKGPAITQAGSQHYGLDDNQYVADGFSHEYTDEEHIQYWVHD